MITVKTLALLPLLLTNIASATEGPIPGYGVEPIQWQMDIHPDRPPVLFNGTVEQLNEHARSLQARWSAEGLKFARSGDTFPAHVDGADDEMRIDDRLATRQLLFDRVDCSGGRFHWETADKRLIKEGIQYLKSVKGHPVNGPGPGNCGRVSCQWGAAIWWCNDNPYPAKLQRFQSISDGAQSIINRCARNSDRVVGQAFYRDHWNVIVRKDHGDGC